MRRRLQGFMNGSRVTIDYSEYPRFEYSEQ
jgi:hypothetical protein